MANIGINITENGTTTLATAGKYCDRNIDVNVGVESAPAVIQALEVTANGTYNAPEGVDGYAPVTVNVPQDGAPTAQELTFSGDCSNLFSKGHFDWFIRKYGNQITTTNINNCTYMFDSSRVTVIPFILNGNSYFEASCSNMFSNCNLLSEIPEIKNLKITSLSNIFSNCHKIREIPLSFALNNDWSAINKNTSSGVSAYMFSNCYSLRTIPPELFKYIINNKQNYYQSLYIGFKSCCSLDEITNLPCYVEAEWNNNAFSDTMNSFYRVNKIEFSLNEDGTPKVSKWKNQTIDLTQNVGVVVITDYITSYNSGITVDKEVKDDATYQALKDDPDWFSRDIGYSRYNHDSAVNTINSLPDTSAYLAEKGGTNTIKFTGTAGSKTDGGAINTLTEAEIAVAAAKGWTVSLT